MPVEGFDGPAVKERAHTVRLSINGFFAFFIVLLEAGATDEAIATLLGSNGTKKTPAEVKAWSDSAESHNAPPL